jgi:hypothetical protein
MTDIEKELEAIASGELWEGHDDEPAYEYCVQEDRQNDAYLGGVNDGRIMLARQLLEQFCGKNINGFGVEECAT